MFLNNLFLPQYENNQNSTNFKQWHKLYNRNHLCIAATYFLVSLNGENWILTCILPNNFLIHSNIGQPDFNLSC